MTFGTIRYAIDGQMDLMRNASFLWWELQVVDVPYVLFFMFPSSFQASKVEKIARGAGVHKELAEAGPRSIGDVSSTACPAMTTGSR